MHIIIIGGGASGFFCALNVARLLPKASVTILEKTSKLLSKVRISGGGRCNVTNAIFDARELVRRYPRGERELLGPFHTFQVTSTVEWFKQRGVTLKIESDGRMFPVTDSSETIIECFLHEASKLGVVVELNAKVLSIAINNNEYEVLTESQQFSANAVVIATGGNTDEPFKNILTKLGHTLVPAVPSLFTFNVPNHPVTKLMGVSVPYAIVKISNSKFIEEGPVLITHWGFSGPAILRLSAWGARFLAEKKYNFEFTINWLGEGNASEITEKLIRYKQNFSNKSILNQELELPKRLWLYLILKCGIGEEAKWQELSKQQLQKLANALCADSYKANGKTTYKEEFVTSGGVSLKEIDFKTMQSKRVPGLYFTGEVIDVDGITGGFNFQNAWTTAWIAANSIAK